MPLTPFAVADVNLDMKLDADDQMMLAFQKGRVRAFDSLYGKYRQPLFGYMFRHVNDNALAEELFQDVWLRVVSAAESYQGKGRFRSWLFAMAHNRLVDHYRRQQADVTELNEERLEGTVDQQAEEGQAALARQRLRQDLDEVVRLLPLEQREVFYLREEAGLALKEIAEIQGITTEAAKSRLRYAYQKLRDALQQRGQK